MPGRTPHPSSHTHNEFALQERHLGCRRGWASWRPHESSDGLTSIHKHEQVEVWGPAHLPRSSVRVMRRQVSALCVLVIVCLLAPPLRAETLGPAGGGGGNPEVISGCGTMAITTRSGAARFPHHMLIGLAVRAGRWLDQVRAICIRFTSVNGMAIWRGVAAQGQTIGGRNGEPFQRICPRNQVVVGMRGRAGFYVDRLRIACQAVTDQGRPTGTVTWLSAVGGDGGEAFGPLMCAAGGAVQFLSGKGGVYVDSVNMGCTAFQFDHLADD